MSHSCHTQVWEPFQASAQHRPPTQRTTREAECTAGSDSSTRAARRPALRESRGQGTVEYVALILLVALVMAGVVAAMKGFRSDPGKELGDAIIGKIKDAVKKVQF